MERLWKRFTEPRRYGELKQSDDGGREGAMAQEASRIKQSRRSMWLRISILLNIILFLVSFSVGSAYLNRAKTLSANEALKEVNTFSPLLERLELPFRYMVTDTPVFNNPSSIFRDLPSHAVDEAWEHVAKMKTFTISKQDVERLGRDPLEAVRAPKEWGHGSEAYLARLESQHHLHCLNTIRKFTYFPHYYAPFLGANISTLNMPFLEQSHLSHCFQALLQALTCQPSIGIFTDAWVEENHRPWADFRVQRKCVNHDAILEWQDKNAWVESHLLNTMTPPPGAILLPTPEEELARGDAESFEKKDPVSM